MEEHGPDLKRSGLRRSFRKIGRLFTGGGGENAGK